MSCLPCFGRRKGKEYSSSDDGSKSAQKKNHDNANNKNGEAPAPPGSGNIQAQTFTFRELAQATKNFTPDCLLGEGGFGRVYKGSLENGGQVVAIKQLDRNSMQGNSEFLVEVLMLSLLHHPNLVNLVGYCADGDQRLLVYEFMNNGNLADHLLDLPSGKQPMDWYTRMKIAYGAAQGLEYLHDKANPPVIYRDFKSSSILLDEALTPKLSDFGLAKLNPMGDKPQFSVMGSYGYSAPEMDRGGQVTMKSDVYSFGVVLLELISGRRAVDDSKPTNEQNLVSWAQPMFKEQKRYPELVDPLLKGAFPSMGLNQIVAIVAMCLQEESSVRPMMADVVVTLSFLVDAPPVPPACAMPTPDQIPHGKEPESSSSGSESSDEDEGEGKDEDKNVVETLQLGLNTRRAQESKPASRASSRSASSTSSRHSSKHGLTNRSSSKHRKQSLRQKSDVGSNDESKRESDEESSSSESSGEEESKQGSGVFLSLKLEGSSKLGSRRLSSKKSEGSPKGSESDEGSDDSSSGDSDESEQEYESD